MADTIRSALIDKYNTKHGLCIWHMLKNVRSNMTSKIGSKYDGFHADLIKYLDHCINQTAFEQALEVREEAEHIFVYKELVYLSSEWSAKDTYMCVETEKNNELHCFELSCYERPDILYWMFYNGYILTCSCRNLEFARIICRHSLAVAVHLSLAQLDPFHFPKCWQKDPFELELAKNYINFYSYSQSQASGTLISYESSSECASQL
ncbi:5370_t:CDS:2 [Dentiscutata heterogama]|uniref:5370_t:CDS:1 n=1 Tax=Dentiscutata heterogama TaxID=1316150 RepID=A0ACA9LD29_9GLOM|nr:5370_t:CDS:2 [Dentiscutata heterogama]